VFSLVVNLLLCNFASSLVKIRKAAGVAERA
jgi:hypothetical protein